MSIEYIYYDIETCKNKVREYLLLYPNIINHMNLLDVSNELCKKDQLFTPNGLWNEYYNIINLKDIINITNNKKILLI